MVPRLSRTLGLLVVVVSLVLPTISVTEAAVQAGFPLTVNTASCQHGYLGPFVDCTPWARVVVAFTAVDQDFAETCVTAPGERTASCTVEVPFGATIVVAIDPGVVPAGYVLEGPAALEIVIPDGPPEGAFGGPSFVLLPVLNEPPLAEPSGGEQPADGFPLPATTAYCEPGYLGPFVGCTPWAGVTVAYASSDGAFATSCTTVAAQNTATCTVAVPFGATVVASIDPAVIPAGYVLEGASAQEFTIPAGPPEGAFGGPSFVLLPASEAPAATETPVAGPTVTQEADGLPAGLYAGTCAGLRAGPPVAALNGLRLPGGARVGAADAVPVATSFTVVNVPFAEVVDGSHLVAVFAEADPETLVACGAIGGTLDDNGALSVGLAAMDRSGRGGVVYISAQEAGLATSFSVFIGELILANLPPIAVDDSYTLTGPGPYEIPAPGVLANDYDVNGDPLTVVNVDAGGAKGGCQWVKEDTDGSLTVLLEAGDTAVWCAVTISDGTHETVSQLEVTVVPAADQPVGAWDIYEVATGGTLTVPAADGVLANDTSPVGNPLTVSLFAGPWVGGSVTLNADGSFTYVSSGNPVDNPIQPIDGVFIYQLTDTVTGASVAAGVRIDVAGGG